MNYNSTLWHCCLGAVWTPPYYSIETIFIGLSFCQCEHTIKALLHIPSSCRVRHCHRQISSLCEQWQTFWRTDWVRNPLCPQCKFDGDCDGDRGGGHVPRPDVQGRGGVVLHMWPIPWCMRYSGMLSCYRPQMKLRKGNVFTCVCQSFCSQGGVQAQAQGVVSAQRGVQAHSRGGVCPGGYPGGEVSRPRPGGVSRPRPSGEGVSRPRPREGCVSQHALRQYASYWNAFLLRLLMFLGPIHSVITITSDRFDLLITYVVAYLHFVSLPTSKKWASLWYLNPNLRPCSAKSYAKYSVVILLWNPNGNPELATLVSHSSVPSLFVLWTGNFERTAYYFFLYFEQETSSELELRILKMAPMVEKYLGQYQKVTPSPNLHSYEWKSTIYRSQHLSKILGQKTKSNYKGDSTSHQ